MSLERGRRDWASVRRASVALRQSAARRRSWRGRSRPLVGIWRRGRTSVRCPRLWDVLYWRCCTVSLREGETPKALLSSSEKARSPQRTRSTCVSNSHEPAWLRTEVRDATNGRIDTLTCVSSAVQKITSNASSAVTQWKRERWVQKFHGRGAPLGASAVRWRWRNAYTSWSTTLLVDFLRTFETSLHHVWRTTTLSGPLRMVLLVLGERGFRSLAPDRPEARREEHDLQEVSVDMHVDGAATLSSAEESDTCTTDLGTASKDDRDGSQAALTSTPRQYLADGHQRWKPIWIKIRQYGRPGNGAGSQGFFTPRYRAENCSQNKSK